MSHTLFFPSGDDENMALLQWAAKRIPWFEPTNSSKALGVVAGPDLSHPLLAVCFYCNYIPPKVIDGKTWYGVCEIGFAADSPRWATRGMISDLLGLPFRQYKCRKILTIIPSSNTRAIEFNKGIGLKPEGTLRHHYAKGVHACIHGMMRSEWEARWKDPQPNIRRPTGSQVNGQQVSILSASA